MAGSWKGFLLNDDILLVRKNTGAYLTARPKLNFIEGSNVTLTVADDGTEIDTTIALSTSPTLVTPDIGVATGTSLGCTQVDATTLHTTTILADHIGEHTGAHTIVIDNTLALGANSLTMSGSIGVTGTRVTKGWFTDLEITNTPTVNGVAIGGESENILTLASNITTQSTSFVNATGLTFSVEANKTYIIEAFLDVTISNSATAIYIGCNGPASPTMISAVGIMVASTVAGAIMNSLVYDFTGIINSNLTTHQPIHLFILFANGANAGTFALRYLTNNASYIATIYAGSTLRYRKVN